MSAVNPEFIERYQLEYQKNPRSKVFAPLAEAYRKMGFLDEALQLCKRGVAQHPDFASGRVALAKILLDKRQTTEALEQLEKAVSLSPENLLAHSLMGETLIEMRRPKDALKAFKMVLFLNPSDERARLAVQKWEFLTAEEYDEEAFAMKPLFRPETQELLPPLEGRPKSERRQTLTPGHLPPNRAVARALSLADAFTVRNELDSAVEVLEAAVQKLGAHPDLESRLRLLSRRLRSEAALADDETDEPPLEPTREGSTGAADPRPHERKRLLLESFLRRINDRRFTTP